MLLLHNCKIKFIRIFHNVFPRFFRCRKRTTHPYILFCFQHSISLHFKCSCGVYRHFTLPIQIPFESFLYILFRYRVQGISPCVNIIKYFLIFHVRFVFFNTNSQLERRNRAKNNNRDISRGKNKITLQFSSYMVVYLLSHTHVPISYSIAKLHQLRS